MAEASEHPSSTERQPAATPASTEGGGDALPTEPWFGQPQESTRARQGDGIRTKPLAGETKTSKGE